MSEYNDATLSEKISVPDWVGCWGSRSGLWRSTLALLGGDSAMGASSSKSSVSSWMKDTALLAEEA